MSCWWVRRENAEGRISYKRFYSAVLAWEFADLFGGWVFAGF